MRLRVDGLTSEFTQKRATRKKPPVIYDLLAQLNSKKPLEFLSMSNNCSHFSFTLKQSIVH